MTQTDAVTCQRVEDLLTSAACTVERAVSVLGTLPVDRPQRRAMLRLLRASQMLEGAADALSDHLEQASFVLAPEAVDVTF